MIKITDKKKCCGCTACMAVCPQNSISLTVDNEGFTYPTVNLETCIDCHLCEKVCPFKTPLIKRKPSRAFAFVHNNDDIHRESSSGGAFTAIATYVLRQKGIVYGARYDDEYQVEICCVRKEEDLFQLRGSKYVQASLNLTFKTIKAKLDAGVLVLFCGTPCQVKGLTLFLRKNYENLYTVDFACHAISSPEVWDRYLRFISKGKVITSVNFRDKEIAGWNNYALKVTCKDEIGDVVSVSEGNHENLFMNGFLSNLFCRPSCSECPARNYSSKSDFTIADFWHVESYHTEDILNGNNGVSLIIDYNKESTIINYLQNQGFLKEVELGEIEDHGVHSCLTGTIKHHEMRNVFFMLLRLGIPIQFCIKFCLSLKNMVLKILRK